MKKILLIIIGLLLFPMVVYAKTPTAEEALNAIGSLKDVTVSDDVTIDSIKVEKYNIIFKINGEDIYVPYSVYDKRLAFGNGYLVVHDDDPTNVTIANNEYSFILYSLLTNASKIPYDEKNFYTSDKIKEIIQKEFIHSFKDPTNTFGVILNPIENNKYIIIYNYYLDGDYPIMYSDGNLLNPATGNYNLLIVIILVSMLGIAAYSYVNHARSIKK